MPALTTTANHAEQSRPADKHPYAAAEQPRPTAKLDALKPLLLDVALPLAAYYVLHSAVGLDLITSLAVSSTIPAARTILSVIRDRTVNALAVLMLITNVAGIALTFVTGDPRLMIAKDGAVSSVIGATILISAFVGRPLMSTALKPMIAALHPAAIPAFDHLSATSRRFRTLERRYSLIWGTALLADCIARIIGALTLPVATMIWLSPVLLIATIAVTALISNAALSPMKSMLKSAAQ